jgi:hypothetical protein
MQYYYEVNRKTAAFQALKNDKKSLKIHLIGVMSKMQKIGNKNVFEKWAEIAYLNRDDRAKVLKTQARQNKSLKHHKFF